MSTRTDLADIVQVENLTCELGGKKILHGVDLRIPAGRIHAILGANGAGKTTLVRVLSTILPPAGGKVIINGHDMATDPAGIRSSIALTGQYAAVDEELTGKENLVFFGQLAGLKKSEAKARAEELLDHFSLNDAGKRRVSNYSGGMRRRLDIACSLVVPPTLLFLDEPTTGLDPASRNDVWDMIENLAASGTAILLTTQYLNEADRLADRISILASGKLIAEGTPSELKKQYGSSYCDISFRTAEQAQQFSEQLARTDNGIDDATVIDGSTVHFEAPRGHRDLVDALLLWHGSQDDIIDAGLTPPSLDEVYLALADEGDVAHQEERAARKAAEEGPTQ